MKLFFTSLVCLSIFFPTTVLKAEEQKLLLVTGCARSGTTYIAKVLKHCGLKVSHEKISPDGVVSWLMVVTSDSAPYGPPYVEGAYKHIFHQVRCPLKTIASVYCNEPPESWRYIQKFLPQIKNTDSVLIKCVKYWIYWNLLAEAKAEFTYRVEDTEEALVTMGEILGIYLPPEAAHLVSKNTNHRAAYEHLYSWCELKELLPSKLYWELRELAMRYGY